MTGSDWDSRWALAAVTTIDELPDGRLSVCVRSGPVIIPGREVEYGWEPLPAGEPPVGTEQWYTLRPARADAARAVKVDGRDGWWEVDDGDVG